MRILKIWHILLKSQHSTREKILSRDKIPLDIQVMTKQCNRVINSTKEPEFCATLGNTDHTGNFHFSREF